jgi:predicted amidophosphoribosyltransferase
MPDPATTPAIDRATVRFQAEPRAALLCSNCGGDVSDDEAECATCESPLDWGASSAALAAWAERAGG